MCKSVRTAEATLFVDSYLGAWNERDAGSVTGHLCANGHYIDETFQEEMTRETLFDELVDYFRSGHYVYEVIGDVLSNGSTIAFQYCAKSLDVGVSARSWHGAEFIKLSGKSALEIRDFYQPPKRGSQISGPEGGGRYIKSGLDQRSMVMLLDRLESCMERERVYLDPDLSLPKLAAHLDTSVNHVSQAINAGLESSFFDYINKKRVEEATKLIRTDAAPHKAILDIALAVGFNSTSTFYSAFRKVTGQTPGVYRRQLASKL